MSGVAVFLGPTLPRDEACAVLDAEYLPPAAHGDVLRAVRRGFRVIGLVDGVFERVPAVWHKEILFALSEGVHVYGAASMGALRAAELGAFGMHGVGAIHRAYAEGALEDDDEVAVAHGGAEDGFRPLSDAMVDIRATLEAIIHQQGDQVLGDLRIDPANPLHPGRVVFEPRLGKHRTMIHGGVRPAHMQDGDALAALRFQIF